MKRASSYITPSQVSQMNLKEASSNKNLLTDEENLVPILNF
jgi:hypothetical protein